MPASPCMHACIVFNLFPFLQDMADLTSWDPATGSPIVMDGKKVKASL